MQNLKVLKIEGDRYTLVNIKDKKEYSFVFRFFDLNQKIEIGDVFAMHQELLDPNYDEYSSKYYFGPLDDLHGRQIVDKQDIDFIAIKTKGKIITLKRVFG